VRDDSYLNVQSPAILAYLRTLVWYLFLNIPTGPGIRVLFSLLTSSCSHSLLNTFQNFPTSLLSPRLFLDSYITGIEMDKRLVLPQ